MEHGPKTGDEVEGLDRIAEEGGTRVESKRKVDELTGHHELHTDRLVKKTQDEDPEHCVGETLEDKVDEISSLYCLADGEGLVAALCFEEGSSVRDSCGLTVEGNDQLAVQTLHGARVVDRELQNAGEIETVSDNVVSAADETDIPADISVVEGHQCRRKLEGEDRGVGRFVLDNRGHRQVEGVSLVGADRGREGRLLGAGVSLFDLTVRGAAVAVKVVAIIAVSQQWHNEVAVSADLRTDAARELVVRFAWACGSSARGFALKASRDVAEGTVDRPIGVSLWDETAQNYVAEPIYQCPLEALANTVHRRRKEGGGVAGLAALGAIRVEEVLGTAGDEGAEAVDVVPDDAPTLSII
jgi:hypothetical protein